MIAAQPQVGPRRRSPQPLILHNRHMIKQLFFAAVVFQALISAQPDAVAVSLHLAAAFARAAAWSVALIFSALRFRAEIRDIRQRAVAAILAAVKYSLAHLFDHTQRGWSLHRVLRARAGLRAPARKRRAG